MPMLRVVHAADIDFSAGPAVAERTLMDRASAALAGLADEDVEWCPGWRRCQGWRARRDFSTGEAYFSGTRHPIGPMEGSEEPRPVKLTYHGGLTDRHSGKEFALLRFGWALWHEELHRVSVASFVDVSLDGERLPTVCVQGMRVQSPRSMLKTLRGLCFHEMGYAPWLGAKGDVGKQQRRAERLIRLSFLLDWKSMAGEQRGAEATRGLRRRWQKLPELLLLLDAEGMRKLARSAPRQLRFFLVCAARMCEGASSDCGALGAYDSWLSSVCFPQIADLLDAAE